MGIPLRYNNLSGTLVTSGTDVTNTIQSAPPYSPGSTTVPVNVMLQYNATTTTWEVRSGVPTPLASTPTFTTATAKQLSVTQNVMLLIQRDHVGRLVMCYRPDIDPGEHSQSQRQPRHGNPVDGARARRVVRRNHLRHHRRPCFHRGHLLMVATPTADQNVNVSGSKELLSVHW
jgi:hypothetical protein